MIVGATFTGPEIAESLHAATVAIVGEVPLERLIHAMPPFPTRSEVWLRCSTRTAQPWIPGAGQVRAGVTAGISSVNVVAPAPERTDSRPDIRSASSEAIASPSPEPWASSAV